MKIALALLAQFAAFWFAVALLAPGAVSLGAWTALYVFALGAFLLWEVARRRNTPPATWAAAFFYSLFFAGLFYALNLGLDVLHGAHRPKADVAGHLGGLEIWFALCPGVASFALAGLVKALLSRGLHIR